jgi:hypothetical protein
MINEKPVSETAIQLPRRPSPDAQPVDAKNTDGKGTGRAIGGTDGLFNPLNRHIDRTNSLDVAARTSAQVSPKDTSAKEFE